MTLKEARKKHNLSQKDLAELTGISQANISIIESGRTLPGLNTRKKIESAIGKVDFLQTRVAGAMEKGKGLDSDVDGSEGIVEAISLYLLSSPSAGRAMKFTFLKALIRGLEKYLNESDY